MTIIPYGRQSIDDEDIAAVIATLKSDYLTQGPKIAEFEETFANYVGAKYAVAVSNGTAALHLSAMAMDVNSGDKVISTPITFAASANCVKYCGGEIVFSDIDPDTYLIDIHKIEKLLASFPDGTFKGIIPVDFGGRAVNLEELKVLANRYNLWIIEDACHAPGGFFIDSNGIEQKCGNGAFADLAVFSFHPVKHIACGEGGMITTNNEDLYKKLLQLRTHGITKTSAEFQNSIELSTGIPEFNHGNYPTWYMEMQELGYNYRLTDFQAALGISQLRKADSGLTRRRQIAEKYDNSFNGNIQIKGHSSVVKGHAYHLYIIEVNDRLGLYNHLREKCIYAQVHYFPCHLMPYYQKQGWKKGDIPQAENYYAGCLSLPMYPTLTEAEQDYVIEMVLKYIS